MDEIIFETNLDANVEIQRKLKNYSFIKIVERLISVQQLRESYSTRLNIYSMTTIKRIIKTNPELFGKIENVVSRKINKEDSENEIENKYGFYDDVDEIISIICELYGIVAVINVLTQRHIELTAEICGYIMKFLFNICVQENFLNKNIENDSDKNELILYYNGIINSNIKLLRVRNPKPLILQGNKENVENNENNENYKYDENDIIVGKDSGCFCF
jgi:hypothetical protein